MTEYIPEEESQINAPDPTVYTLNTVNCIPIYEDMKYFFKKSINKTLEIEERNRNARAAIIYMAFFIESLANYISLKHEVAVTKEEIQVLFLSRPIITLQKIYKKVFEKDMELDISGLQDIFFLRNNIIAYATGITTKISNNPDLITTYPYTYKVLKDPPNAYVDFNHSYAEILHEEMIAILKKYFVLMGDNLPKNLGYQIPLV